jgi:hypothetical protein
MLRRNDQAGDVMPVMFNEKTAVFQRGLIFGKASSGE